MAHTGNYYNLRRLHVRAVYRKALVDFVPNRRSTILEHVGYAADARHFGTMLDYTPIPSITRAKAAQRSGKVSIVAIDLQLVASIRRPSLAKDLPEIFGVRLEGAAFAFIERLHGAPVVSTRSFFGNLESRKLLTPLEDSIPRRPK